MLHPVTGDLYTAVRGEGAFLNGAKIEVRAAEGLGDALVMNNIGAARDDAFIATTLARLGELLRRKVQAIRMSGEMRSRGGEKSAEGWGFWNSDARKVTIDAWDTGQTPLRRSSLPQPHERCAYAGAKHPAESGRKTRG